MCWKRLTKFYEIEDAHFHDLRHLSLQRFFTVKKLSVPEVQVISGHLEPRTLLKVYANLKAEDLVHKLN
jgi:integrase